VSNEGMHGTANERCAAWRMTWTASLEHMR
jgi:hypothetical protein